jgi:hypothetical protein
MIGSCCRLSPQVLLWSGLVLVYFVLYPRDLFAPVESLSSVAVVLLQVTMSVSPWLYGFASVCVVAWTAVCITDRILAKDRRTN